MTTRLLFGISLCLLVFGWVVISWADFNALYKFEVNLASMGNGMAPAYWTYLSENSEELLKRIAPRIDHPRIIVLELLFVAPAFALAVFRGSRPLQFVIVAGIVLLALGDLFQLHTYEGGDRKGCEGCFAWMLVHAAFGLLATLLATALLLWLAARTLLRRFQRSA